MKKNFLKFLLLMATSILLFSCNDEEVKSVLTFHTCEAKASYNVSREKLQMPISKFEVIVNKKEFMTSADFDSVDIAEVRTPNGGAIRGFLFNCNEKGVKKLFRETSANLGGWILLKENGQPVGLRKVDIAMQDGKLFMLLEFPEGTDLTKKALDYNESIKIISAKVRDEEKIMLW